MDAEELLEKYAAGQRNFQGADLRKANLKKTNLTRADLTDATTYGWLIEDADFSRAIMPDGEVYKPIASQVEIGKQETS